MLRNFLIFSLCFVAIRATGEFSVLSHPKAISFKGNDALQSQYVGDVLYAAMGNAISGESQWSVFNVNDPFNLPSSVVAVLVDGVSTIGVNSNAKSYALEGSNSYESLNALSAELEANNSPVCDIDFEKFDEAVITYRSCFGDLAVPAIKETKNLNPALHTADKQFLQSVGFVNAITENLSKSAINLVIVRLSLEPIAKAHGEKSEAMAEANKLVSAAIGKLNTAAQKASNNAALVVAISEKAVGARAKREVLAADATNNYNLAEYYNDDYPVIFNIILWFMVTFGLALLAICYAIGSMDPGRDSIIYRMTSTRMKKDN